MFETYYAQKDFFKLNKRWASPCGELAIAGKLPDGLADAKLRSADGGYQCEISQHTPKLIERWRIEQDSKLIHLIGE